MLRLQQDLLRKARIVHDFQISGKVTVVVTDLVHLDHVYVYTV